MAYVLIHMKERRRKKENEKKGKEKGISWNQKPVNGDEKTQKTRVDAQKHVF